VLVKVRGNVCALCKDSDYNHAYPPTRVIANVVKRSRKNNAGLIFSRLPRGFFKPLARTG
jgi:hypothetical protein